MTTPRLAFRTQNELDGHYVTFKDVDEPSIATLGQAIDYTVQVVRACSGTAQVNPRFAADGNFHLAALIGWTLGRKFEVRGLPGDPASPLLLGDAREYLLRVLDAMKNPTHAGFWPWYWEDCLGRGAHAVEEQVVDVKLAWLADKSGTPPERARRLVAALRRRFQLMHDLFEVSRDTPFDYGHVAQVAHEVVADVLPQRSPRPEGRRSFANLLADLNDLDARLNGAHTHGSANDDAPDRPDSDFIARIRRVLEQHTQPLKRDALLTEADLPVGGRSYGKLSWMADHSCVFSGPKGFALKPYGRKRRGNT